jgi:hypothetical protein
MTTNERIEQFKADVTELKLKTGNTSTENLLLVLGLVLMIAAFVIAIATYQVSLNSESSLDLQSYIILAISMGILALLGASLFLRYSLAKFLRFWLLRQLYEGQAHVDQVVDALKTPK